MCEVITKFRVSLAHVLLVDQFHILPFAFFCLSLLFFSVVVSGELPPAGGFRHPVSVGGNRDT